MDEGKMDDDDEMDNDDDTDEMRPARVLARRHASGSSFGSGMSVSLEFLLADVRLARVLAQK